MNDDVVVDASVVLALLKGEPFNKFDPEKVVGAWISAVNVSEVLLKLIAGGLTPNQAEEAMAAMNFRVVSFDEVHARAAARLWSSTKALGLSLGDRACLATALSAGLPAVTADKAWAKLPLKITVHLVR